LTDVSLQHCELCPNEGGIYKETDAKRWDIILGDT